MKTSFVTAFLSIFIAFGFTDQKIHHPIIDTTFYYLSENKFIGSGDVKSIEPIELNNADKWDAEVTPCFSFGTGSYLSAISFQEDDANPANGGSDGDLTLQEAINALKAIYISTGTLPANGANLTIDAAVVTIHRTSSDCPIH